MGFRGQHPKLFGLTLNVLEEMKIFQRVSFQINSCISEDSFNSTHVTFYHNYHSEVFSKHQKKILWYHYRSTDNMYVWCRKEK